MNDPASVLIHTVGLLAVAVVAGAVGSLRGRLEATRDLVLSLQARLETLRHEQERDRAALAAVSAEQDRERSRVTAVRDAVRRLDAYAPELDDPPDPPIGFRPPGQR